MANEPERPIEKLLRAAANKRRDEAGAPVELHPANRRLLQGEVARTLAKPQRPSRSFAGVLLRLWPQFAGAAGLVAILGMTLWLLLPSLGGGKRETSLARNGGSSEPMLAKELRLPAQTTAERIAPPAAPVPKKEPTVIAYANTPQAAPVASARQPLTEPQPVAGPATASWEPSQAKDKIALDAAHQLADRQEPARLNLAASSSPPTQAPVGSLGGAVTMRYGLASTPVPPASTPPVAAQPPAPAGMPATSTALAAAERPKLTPADSGQAGVYYRSLATDESANRLNPSLAAKDSLLTGVPEVAKKAKAPAVIQRFVQILPEGKAQGSFADRPTATHPVLASFEVEQAGRELRIVDGDGSVYRGCLQLATTTRRARAPEAEAPAAARSSRAMGAVLEERAASSLDLDQLAPQTYSFRVTGTNRSLNKKVVFIGNLLTATNMYLTRPAQTNLGDATGFSRFQPGPAQPSLPPLLNSRISGKVVIGSGKAVEINALPTNP